MTARPDPRRPASTYRLQLHAGFGFDDAAAIVPYLARLGVSHLYLSPILQAVPGGMILVTCITLPYTIVPRKKIGAAMAVALIAKGIKAVVFDRNGYSDTQITRLRDRTKAELERSKVFLSLLES